MKNVLPEAALSSLHCGDDSVKSSVTSRELLCLRQVIENEEDFHPISGKHGFNYVGDILQMTKEGDE